MNNKPTTKEVKVLMKEPPCYDSVCLAFNTKINAYFTYGDTIYCVGVPYPAPDIIEHEQAHMAQQLAMCGENTEPTPENYEKGARLWWGRFLREVDFRIDQEARAYGAQYAMICKRIPHRQMRFEVLQQLSRTLSGPLYNNSINLIGAMQRIKEYSGVK